MINQLFGIAFQQLQLQVEAIDQSDLLRRL